MGIATTVELPRYNIGQPASVSLRSRNGTLQGLRLLGLLRIFAPLAQATLLLVVMQRYGVEVALAPIAGLLAIESLVAAATWLRLRRAPVVSELELLGQVHIDIALFAVLLYLNGGNSNPFAPLLLLPLAIAASTLAPRWVWVAAISTILAFALQCDHWPLMHPLGESAESRLHQDGMAVNFLFAAALLAFACSRMQAALRGHARMHADAREAQLRNESVVAIGALAAGYAHELSAPLATMAVVVAELKRERSADPRLQ
ncbi:MAG: hypothetical protein WA210_04380 [Burkholderiaceae bacterium]